MAAFDLPMNDPHLSSVFTNSGSNSSGMLSSMERSDAAQSTTPTANIAPTPAVEHLPGFLSSVPPVVTRLLVELGPFLSRLRWALQVLSWKSGVTSESWLALATLWGLCLWFHFTVRYFLPVLIFAPYMAAAALSYIRPSTLTAKEAVPTPEAATESTVQASLADVSTIHHLLPKLPPLMTFQLPIPSIIRLILVAYLAYAIIVFILPTNLIIAIVGTFVMTWRAPWARTIRHILLSNGWIRYATRRIWGAATGTVITEDSIQPIDTKSDASSARPLSTERKVGVSSTSGSTAELEIPSDVPPPSSLRFRFIVHENQRWWMGLDWTAALLPNERASWTSAPPALKPVPPPMGITLPPTTTVYLPVSSGRGRDNLRMKRTATWTWSDPAWAVVVRLNPTSTAERVVMALPKVQPTDSTAVESSSAGTATSPGASASGPEGFLQRGLQRIGTTVEFGSSNASLSPSKPRTSGGFGGRSSSPDNARRARRSEDAGSTHLDEEDEEHHDDIPQAKEEEETPLTDAEGWVYGDNKWEGSSGKGGIGKFTRSRRWTRVALLTETITIVRASDDPRSPSKFPSKTPSISPAHPVNGSSSSPMMPNPPSYPTTTKPGASTSPKLMVKTLPVSPTIATDSATTVTPAATANGARDGGSSLRNRLQQAVGTK